MRKLILGLFLLATIFAAPAARAAQALTADRVQETTTTTGTGTITLAGAVTGYRTFAAAFSTGNLIQYAIVSDSGTEWEVGNGTLATTSTLSRDTIVASSNAGSAVNFSAGSKHIFATLHGTTANSTVLGPTSATDNAIVRFDATTGKLVQDSAVTVADSTGNLQWEGTTADAFEGNFTFADPTEDWTWAWGADGTLTGPLGGVVIGPASATDSEIVAFNSTTGKLVKASGIKMNSGFIVHSDDGTGGIFNSLSGQIAGWLINGNSNGYVSAYAAGSGGIVTIYKRATNDFNLGLQATTGIYWVSSGNGADNSANADAGLDRLAPGIVVTTDGTESGLGWSYQDGKKALSADFTSTSATPANLTGLTVTLRTGRKYTFRMALRFSDSTAADGARFDFDGGTATATDFGVSCQVYDSTLLHVLDTTALATDLVATTTTGASSIKCDGSFTVNAAGTFIPRAGQEAASGGTLTVETGSFLHVTDTSFN